MSETKTQQSNKSLNNKIMLLLYSHSPTDTIIKEIETILKSDNLKTIEQETILASSINNVHYLIQELLINDYRTTITTDILQEYIFNRQDELYKPILIKLSKQLNAKEITQKHLIELLSPVINRIYSFSQDKMYTLLKFIIDNNILLSENSIKTIIETCVQYDYTRVFELCMILLQKKHSNLDYTILYKYNIIQTVPSRSILSTIVNYFKLKDILLHLKDNNLLDRINLFDISYNLRDLFTIYNKNIKDYTIQQLSLVFDIDFKKLLRDFPEFMRTRVGSIVFEYASQKETKSLESKQIDNTRLDFIKYTLSDRKFKSLIYKEKLYYITKIEECKTVGNITSCKSDKKVEICIKNYEECSKKLDELEILYVNCDIIDDIVM